MTRSSKGFDVDPWHVRWRGLDLDALNRTESLFALSNGHIGLRGTFEEGEPTGKPGTYLNGFFERRPLPYAEGGYGYPEDGQTVVNVTDGKIIRLLVEDEPMDMRYGSADEHERILDFRTGTLRRHTVWMSPTGRRVRIVSERLVSFTERAIVAMRYEVFPLDEDLEFVVQSELLANEPVRAEGNDPRLAAVLDSPLVADGAIARDNRAILAHHTRSSDLRMAAGMDHEVEVESTPHCELVADGDLARLTVAAAVAEGSSLRVTKYVSYGWSSRRSTPALFAQVEAALAAARGIGWDELVARQRAYLDDFWEDADLELTGDAELQQAVRFALFHTLQAGARGEKRAIPAKGLTGPGYDGHAFWDTEAYVLPVLTYTVPMAVGDALRWRYATLDKAKARAAELGLGGAVFSWRSIDGNECSGYWPAGTAAFHVGAAIAYAVTRYIAASGDTEFEKDCGVELLVETARLWASLGHNEPGGEFRIDGVTGPDEYSAVADNNLYTNLMAQHNLCAAADACRRHPEIARRLHVDNEETAQWRHSAEHMRIPYNDELDVHEQADDFTRHAEWDFENTPAANYPLLLHYPYFDLYRKQVIKQADLMLAMYVRGDAFTLAEKSRNFVYYEARTVHDSSLSASIHAVIAAEVGQLDLAYDYLANAALTDLNDLHHNVESGLHIASLAGSWIACVAGFGGMRDYGGRVSFAPQLPQQLSRLRFRMRVGASRIEVDISSDSATYRLLTGDAIELRHHGNEFTLGDGDTEYELPIRSRPGGPTPAHPAGRRPEVRDG